MAEEISAGAESLIPEKVDPVRCAEKKAGVQRNNKAPVPRQAFGHDRVS